MENSSPFEVLVIGGSAGSLSMVLKLIPFINAELDIPIIIVFHRKQSEETILIDLLTRRAHYSVKEIEDKDVMGSRMIYLAPADYHVLVEKDKTLSLDDSEKINFSRPSIDVTFESAAEVYGRSLACLLLSGANADGVKGLQKAASRGATIIVQDPRSAEVPFMPQQAIDNVKVDFLIHDNNLQELMYVLLKEKRP